MPRGVPDKPGLEGLEERWYARWISDGTYRFDRSKTREDVFSIDTPPPTVSGSLHMGSAFGYVQTDAIARYQRMRGRAVFYPMGWDDNGLATERRVQNYFGVRCEPHLPYDREVTPPTEPPKDAVPISRPNFLELCGQLVVEDEKAFEELLRRLGLSVDWTLTYTTVGTTARRTSQRMFLRNLARDEAYQAEAPTLWDVDYRTAVAQAELEDREMPGAYHALNFHKTDGSGDVVIDTTRPELLAACVALVAHPDDERYTKLFDTTVRTPLYDVEVPVVAHRLADPDKGTGIAMICTFGDTTDVVWWRELHLPTRAIVGPDGRIKSEPPSGIGSGVGAAAYGEIAGKTVKQAQKIVVEQLTQSGEMVGDPRPVTHPVKFYEKGDRPLEIVTSRQWYYRNGGRDAELREELLRLGRELRWHPPHMRTRYENWIEGLNSDWLISRQRYFGVPFPVWYRIDADGNVDYDQRLLADEGALPVDPSTDAPPSFDEAQRGRANGFIGDPDVMDTWATSSLTPQIVTGWVDDPDLQARTFPMDLRPQGPEIIRTWLFYTVVRAWFEDHTLPWSDTTINGWVLDPDRKKMSKSKGNVVTPMPLVEQYGADALRYWACNGRPAVDTAVDYGVMKIGRKLAIKILNLSKFVLGANVAGDANDDLTNVTEPLDRALLRALAGVIDEATTAFDGYDYARALERVEEFFWGFCDDYVELVKARAYDGDAARTASARTTLRVALSTLLRLLAPFLPFVTEEAWSWSHDGSVHGAPWPSEPETTSVAAGADAAVYAVAAEVLGAVRKVKSEHKRSLATPADDVVVRDTAARLAQLELARSDVADAGKIVHLRTEVAETFSVDVRLADAG
jgi:valyl-tRNA synthetase